MNAKQLRAGFTLIEVIIVLLIGMLLSAVAIPYYQSALEAAHLTEANLIWGELKRQATGHNLSLRRNRLTQEINTARLKHFTIQILCRTPQSEEEPSPSTPSSCWEAEFYLQHPNQSIRYYLATQNNFTQLVCIGLNDAGRSFCQSQAAKDFKEKTDFKQQEAYILHY